MKSFKEYETFLRRNDDVKKQFLTKGRESLSPYIEDLIPGAVRIYRNILNFSEQCKLAEYLYLIDGCDTYQKDEFVHKCNYLRRNYQPINKLRWKTLGTHYNWLERRFLVGESLFNSSCNCRNFNPLIRLNEMINTATSRENIHFPDLFTNDYYNLKHCSNKQDLPKHVGVIVNFYDAINRISDRLCGHRDDTPGEDIETPLVSLSIGHSCIFIIGNSEEEYDSTVLYGGDIVVMYNKGRIFKHAVPRVFEDVDYTEFLQQHKNTENIDYSQYRINVSFRTSMGSL